MKGRVVVLIIFALLSFPVPVFSKSPSLVINSFKVSGGTGKTTDEFVEIYNPTTAKIVIENWQLGKKTSKGNYYPLLSVFPLTVINSRESVIVGHKDSVLKPDILYDTSNSISDDNTIVLFSDQGTTVVDLVGFGGAKEFEVKPVPEAKVNLWKRTNGLDTDNNFNDFKVAAVNTKDYSGICLSEVMPKGDEWLEIYNSEMTKDISGLIIGDISGALKKFSVPDGTIIKEGEYKVFSKKETGLSLNDSGDGLILIDGNGKIFDQTGNYGKVQSEASFAFDGKAWKWTLKPTPGSANIITNVSAVQSSAKNIGSDISDSEKGTLPQAEVLGAQNENADELFNKKQKLNTVKDQLLGYVLIGVALIGGFLYTLFVNREKLLEVFDKERGRYQKSWQNFRGKIKRG